MRIDLKTICVPTDFSANADHAIKYAETLAKEFGATVHLLHVIQDIETYITEPTGLAGWSTLEILNDLKRAGEEQLTRIAQTVDKGVGTVKALRHGAPFQEICRYAKENDIDLLVLGTHGRSGLKHFFLGSVAERVVRSSPCPVLTVRHPEHDFVLPD